jgi:hypothetical protein
VYNKTRAGNVKLLLLQIHILAEAPTNMVCTIDVIQSYAQKFKKITNSSQQSQHMHISEDYAAK